MFILAFTFILNNGSIVIVCISEKKEYLTETEQSMVQDKGDFF